MRLRPKTTRSLQAQKHSCGGNASSFDAEAWETSNTWYPEAWNEPLGSDWSQDGWVNHLSSDWDDSAWFDSWDTSEWTWDDNTSVVSYPSTAVNAVTQAPPGLELPKSTPQVRFETSSDDTAGTTTVNAGTTLTSSRQQGTAGGPRSNVAGLFIATMMATFTLGESCSTFINTCNQENPRYVFADPLLVNNINANFEPDNQTILFDSGASVHCCPLDFGDKWPLLPLHGVVPNLRAVSQSLCMVNVS